MRNLQRRDDAGATMLDWWRRFFSKFRAAGAGAQGERAAADFLRRRKGYAIVVSNWRNPRDRRDELDLVCRDGETLVFVEVKARAAGALVPGYHAVDRRKKRVLRRTIEAYLKQLAVRPRSFRLDVVEVALPPESATAGAEPGDAEILHFENIPLFGKHFQG
jgi:putative endonuclease